MVIYIILLRKRLLGIDWMYRYFYGEWTDLRYFFDVAISHGRSLLYLAFLLYRHVISRSCFLLLYSLYLAVLCIRCSEVGIIFPWLSRKHSLYFFSPSHQKASCTFSFLIWTPAVLPPSFRSLGVPPYFNVHRASRDRWIDPRGKEVLRDRESAWVVGPKN